MTLSRHIIDDFPQYYPYFQETEFTWNGITQPNRNPLLKLGIGVDGLKTGHTAEAGYGLVGSAVQNGQRMIFMVGGLASEAERADRDRGDREMGVRRLRHRAASSTPAPRSPRPRSGSARRPTVALVAPHDLQMLVPARGARAASRRACVYDGPIEAPIAQGQKLGALEVDVPGHEPVAFDLVAGADVPRGGLMTRINAAARLTRDRALGLPARPTEAHGRGGASSASRASTARASRRSSARSPRALRARRPRVVETREPGGAPGAEQIRRLLVEGDPGRWSPETEILLFTAARRDHLERTIRPALARGATVISDRFADSTRVYQGVARADLRGMVDALHALAIGLEPDLTLILDLDPDDRARPRPRPRRPEDRFERFGAGFQARLRAGFLALAAEFPARCRVVPADGDADAVAARVAARWSDHERARGARPAARRAAPARDRGALRPGRRPRRAFLAAAATGRLHHAWLLTGPRGVGKATLAWRIARHLIAGGTRRVARHGPRPTRSSASSRRLASPQLFLCRRPWDDKAERLRTAITVDEVRALKGFFQLSAADGGRRVAIVDAADELNGAAANALLKILEEPPAARGAPARLPPPGRAAADAPLALPRAPLRPLDPEPLAARARRRRRRRRTRRRRGCSPRSPAARSAPRSASSPATASPSTPRSSRSSRTAPRRPPPRHRARRGRRRPRRRRALRADPRARPPRARPPRAAPPRAATSRRSPPAEAALFARLGAHPGAGPALGRARPRARRARRPRPRRQP